MFGIPLIEWIGYLELIAISGSSSKFNNSFCKYILLI